MALAATDNHNRAGKKRRFGASFFKMKIYDSFIKLLAALRDLMILALATVCLAALVLFTALGLNLIIS